MLTSLIVFFGAGLGGMLRHWVNYISAYYFGTNFPIGTLCVNVVGSLTMGILISVFSLKGESIPHLRLFLTTGILGGFTTFSAYSLDVVVLYERGESTLAIGYAVVSVVLSVTAVLIGMSLMRQVIG